MSDGVRLRKTWINALDEAEAHFRRLLTSPSSEWKRVPNPTDGPIANYKNKSRASSLPELSDVAIHRKPSKSGGDIYRMMLDVPTGDDIVTLEPWKAVLGTPELRQEWDPAVECAHLVEMFDNRTRICMTKFTLGWPANPRDAVTVARSFHDASTLIDISTSLPRSLDEPVYLRPSPPYVRSHITLFAWCIQYVAPPPPQPQQQNLQPPETPKRKGSHGGRIRVTSFWQHDLRALWNLGFNSNISQQLCTMVLGLLKTVVKRGSRIPILNGYGHGVSIERIRFQADREALTVEYAIIPEEGENSVPDEDGPQGMEGLATKRESRRLTRSIECVLPASEGWDVQLSTRASSLQVEKLPWVAKAVKSYLNSLIPTSIQQLEQTILRVTHSPLLDDHSVLKVKVTIELSTTPGGLRLNGLPHAVEDVEERNPSSYYMSESILQDIGSTADLSLHSASSIHTTESSTSSRSIAAPVHPQLIRTPAGRTAAAEKSILSRVKRNYIYFSSLLQEPEAKWKRTTEVRGVGVTQLDSIDPTLVVYRAEATFVGVGLWDLYGALVSPGARVFWDKQHDDATLLEDVNELTELWHIKTKPAWPIVGRDSVVLKTVYKSPTAIHVFAFSADEPHLFPSIPPVDPNVIRTQVDLQGWAIEALSPTTTLLTLLEQSDPKGWTNKASIPQQMINVVAGVGEFAIKCGGPPVMTRLSGAKANEIRYDHERGSFRVEYEGSAKRRNPSPSDGSQTPSSAMQMPVIECELRCDIDSWASSLDVVVDPPPQSIACLRRHRLSEGGGGLWLTLTHDAVFVDDERLLAIVRRGPGREKGVVMLNGAKVTVDAEEISEAEIKSLSKRKRNKPARIPLDQPPVLGVIRRRRAEWNSDADSSGRTTPEPGSAGGTFAWASSPKFSSPLARFLTSAVEQAANTTQQAVAAISATAPVESLSPSRAPMQYALEALSWIQEAHCHYSPDDWALVSEKGLAVHKKVAPELSPAMSVHRGQKVIEGVSAEELSSVVTQYDCRKRWDDRFDSAFVLEAYGAECFTSFVVSKSAFPFRDRGFYLASVMARGSPLPSQSRRNTADSEQLSSWRHAIFCVATSFSPDSVSMFPKAMYNPHALPIGRVFIDGWVLETLDPYAAENYAIPSTRCTRFVAVDYAGSIPTAVNSVINASLPLSILTVEAYAKTLSPLPAIRLPAPGLVTWDAKGEELVAAAWKVKRRDDNRLLISTKYADEGKTYRCQFLLMMPMPATRVPVTNHNDVTPRPSTVPPRNSSPVAESSSTPPNEATLVAPIARRRRISSNTSSVSFPARDTTPSPSKGLIAIPSRSPSSSMFTIRGELRHLTDLLVAEIIVDSRLYPDGYSVMIGSRVRDGPKRISLVVPERAVESQSALPISCTIYTLPVSGLHSSGLNADKPTRHLLRLFLPTAQYQMSTVVDPLTGETRAPPPKPRWLVDLQASGAVVEVEIKPAVSGSKGVVLVNEREINVANEKESLTALGREELLDDRASKLAVVTRTTDQSDSKSDELTAPIAAAEQFLNSTVTKAPTKEKEVKDAEKVSAIPEGSEDTNDNSQPTRPRLEAQAVSAGSSGLLGFLQSYPNPLSRFGVSPHGSAHASPSLSNGESSGRPRAPSGGLTRDENVSASSSTKSGIKYSTNAYPLSTIVIVALISFLVGSLLRSLLSPADFIYVVSDLKEGEGMQRGWREIKRLFEMKYIVGGWDFQVAVVRRH